MLGKRRWMKAGAAAVPTRRLCLAVFHTNLALKHLILEILVASQRGVVSGGASWARSELVATSYLQRLQPQPSAAPHHATGS